MGDFEIGEDGIIDWDQMFNELPEDLEVFVGDPPVVSDSPPDVLSDSSPDSAPSWIDEIENLLMGDDNNEVVVEHNLEFCQGFLADVVLDQPADVDADADAPGVKDSTVVDSSGEVDASNDKNSNVSDDDRPQLEKIDGDNENGKDHGVDEDQASKKKRRYM